MAVSWDAGSGWKEAMGDAGSGLRCSCGDAGFGAGMKQWEQ